MLYSEGISPEKNYLAAKSAYDVAAVRVRSARERLRLATEAARSSTRMMGLQDSAFEHAINSGQITGAVALLSPVAGSVIFRDMTPGESVDTRKRVFTILDLSQVWVVVDVFQEKTPKVIIGQEVVISSASGQQLAGTVSSIGSVVDATKRTLPVRIVVNNKDGTLKPGTFVTGEIAIAIGQKPSLVVPSGALIEEAGRTLVFVKRGTLFVPVEVVAGARSSGMVAVSGKIAEGELVVVNGARQLYAQTLLNSRQGHKPGEGDLQESDAEHQHGDHQHGETAHHDHSQHEHAPDARSDGSKIVGLIVEQLPGIGMGVALSMLFALVWSLLKKHAR